MISFQGLANVKEATIATVAPGISEALIATAMGLFAAIPAVWAYNRYATKVERLTVRYEPSPKSSPRSCSARRTSTTVTRMPASGVDRARCTIPTRGPP